MWSLCWDLTAVDICKTKNMATIVYQVNNVSQPQILFSLFANLQFVANENK